MAYRHEPPPAEDETPEARRKRLKMRSWRRGTKEMDLILGPFADAVIGDLDGRSLDQFEALLAESDIDLYRWVSRTAPEPETHWDMLKTLRVFHNID